jgi:hypothetical protein
MGARGCTATSITTTNIRCVTTQKSEDPINTSAEAAVFMGYYNICKCMCSFHNQWLKHFSQKQNRYRQDKTILSQIRICQIPPLEANSTSANQEIPPHFMEPECSLP